MNNQITPFLQGNALLADILQASSDPSVFHCWWLGQSGFLLRWGEKFLLLDPYLSDSLTKKYADTTKPHVRMTKLAIDPARLDFLHVVTSSHNHTDHLDGETLVPLLKANPGLQLLIPEANRAFVANRLGCELHFPIGINDEQTIDIHGFSFHAVPAAHERIDRNEQGQCHYLGYVVSFGGFSIYHSGDTILYEGMADLLRPFSVDIAFLPINGADPKRGVAGNLNAEEAAELGKAIGARLVVPCHYDMFQFNTANPADFAATAKRLHLNYRVMQCGERISIVRQQRGSAQIL